MKTSTTLYIFVFLLLSSLNSVKSQEKRYQFTLAAGTGFSFGLDNLKRPGYDVKVYAEKFFNNNDTKTYLLAFNYLRQDPLPAVIRPDIPDSSIKVTTHFHKATVVTATFGGRKFFDNGLIIGCGIGAGTFSQVYPTKTYSDGSRYYDQYEHTIGDIGIAHLFQVGYKPGPVQILVTANSIWLPFRVSTDSDYEVATPLLLPTFSFAVGYTF